MPHGRLEEAATELERALELDPTYGPAHFVVANGYRYLGKFDEALDAQRKAVECSGGIAMMLGWLGLTWRVVIGRPKRAR